jgi:hypothetical protein
MDTSETYQAAGTEDLSKETAKVMLVEAVWMNPYLAYLI